MFSYPVSSSTRLDSVWNWPTDLASTAFNLIEILCLVAPFEWWLPQEQYAKLNDVVMGIIYSPLLVITAWLETRQAERIRWNRRHGEEDEDSTQEWELVAVEVDFDLDDTWKEEVKQTTPDIKVDNATAEVRQLKEQVATLTDLVKKLSDASAGSGAT